MSICGTLILIFLIGLNQWSSYHNTSLQFWDKLSHLTSALCYWFHFHFNNLARDVEILKHHIMGIQASTKYFHSHFLQSLEVTLSKEYHLKLNQLKTFLAQRSRIQWLKLGDQNTNFFHSVAKMYTRRNYIHELQKPDVTIVNSMNDMHNIAQDYFHNLFSDPGDSFPSLTFSLRHEV